MGLDDMRWMFMGRKGGQDRGGGLREGREGIYGEEK